MPPARALPALLLCAGHAAPAPPVTLNFVGDVMLARGVFQSALERGKSGKADWAGVFSSVRADLGRADLTVGNLESPLTSAPFAGGRYDLRAPLEAARALSPFDALSIVNNHTGDGGKAGQAQTRTALHKAGIQPLEGALWVKTLQGRKFGFLALLDEGTSPILEPSWNATLERVQQAARKVDVLTVLIHWGAEYSPVTARQRNLARALEGAGARLIVGSGPHVLQPVEKVGRAWVAYSLGNFVFDSAMPSTRFGAILRVTVRDGALALSALPTRIRAGRVELADAETAETVLERLKLPSSGKTLLSAADRKPTPHSLLPTPCSFLRLPKTWDVRSSAWGDVTGDGVPECVLAVWRPWRGWKVEKWGPKRPSPVGHNRDARGDSSNVVVLEPLGSDARDRLGGGRYREIWAGSPLAIPVLRLWLEREEGRLMLVTLEGSYRAGRSGPAAARAVWRYKPFGFELVRRVTLP